MAPQPAGTGSTGDAAVNPTLLAGFTIAVISHRRRHRLADLIEQHGARIVSVQGVRAVPQPDADALRRATTTCLDRPLDDVVVSSSTGMRAWLHAAPDPSRLLAAFSSARLLAADARTADALRANDLHDVLSTATGTAEGLYRYLLTHQPDGRRIAAQLDTPDQAEHCQSLRLRGADVVELPTYVTEPPNDVVGVRRVVELMSRRQLDAVAWTDPVAAGHILRFATAHGRLPAVVAQLGAHIPTVCRGPLAAAVLRGHGVEPATSPMPFDEETAALLARSVLDRAVHATVGGLVLEVRGHAALIDGRLYPIQQGPVGVLRALAAEPGKLLSSADIRRLVPGLTDVDDHAIEMTVSRLRRAMPDLDLVQTVIKRGYRLAV
ncbi:uroporphyrinogen-III synthase [Dactylosporangium sp. AC04546]|uniref:uroporphyrinogen-III synthase n=1 Tax=Dactylosporangium sp. AC04546 TaxID=2862460 RepID=UPI001EDCC140|nr:uroporphyrinogen-III synthase [Dactylosporangium sp. AC04546]WVK86687.1 uroporphyrinogen-III synthase [Dactylosporangium sp. AC04546]